MNKRMSRSVRTMCMRLSTYSGMPMKIAITIGMYGSTLSSYVARILSMYLNLSE